ncbi:MFS transporter [Pseudoduganella sp. OTU4001]|uniref:MFS transporter n=1 Tax=Pseudoduganella sp. OTU4001 TaxID=3043854 RepID=UPI00313BC003
MKTQSSPVWVLGVTQVISWGILYYAFGVMAPAIQAELQLAPAQLYGAFSWAVLVAGVASVPVGILIDRIGGRRVMAAGSLVSGAGLLVLAWCSGVAGYFAAWTVMGAGMAMTLYEAAFATLNRSLREASRKAISNVTLMGGLASTVFWPLTAWLLGRQDWRQTCLVFAAALLAVCLPLHLLLDDGAPPAPALARKDGQQHYSLRQAVAEPVFWLLASVFAAHAFTFSALSVHMIPLIRRIGHAGHLAVTLAALIGPMQVAGRLVERALVGRATPQAVGVVTFAGLPAALLVLYALGASAWAVVLFCLIYGMTNGVLTILRGTLPQAVFGHAHYGAIAGALAAPSLIAKAGAPLLLAFMLEGGAYQPLLGGLFLLSLASFALYLFAVRSQERGLWRSRAPM